MYQFLINIAQPLIKALGLFSTKIRKGVEGRKHALDILKAANLKTKKLMVSLCLTRVNMSKGYLFSLQLKINFQIII